MEKGDFFVDIRFVTRKGAFQGLFLFPFSSVFFCQSRGSGSSRVVERERRWIAWFDHVRDGLTTFFRRLSGFLQVRWSLDRVS